MSVEIVWRRCVGCRRLFRAPIWRALCMDCGGDEGSLWPLFAFVAAADLLMLLAWKFVG